MTKVFIKRKKLNEDVIIDDPTIAQQYLAVKKQITDKRTKRDQLMRNINQLDSEMNILDKNLIALQSKAVQQKGELQVKEQPAESEEKEEETSESLGEALEEECLTENSGWDLNDFREAVISSIDEKYADGETLVYEFQSILDNCFNDGDSPEDCAEFVISADRRIKDLEESGYIGGDNRGKFIANRSTPIRVAEYLEFHVEEKLPDKYEKYTVIKINGKEKIIKDIEKYENDAILTFMDDTTTAASELEKEDVEFVRELNYMEIEDIKGPEDTTQQDEIEDKIRELEEELKDLEQEENNLRIEMEEELADYEETTHQPDKSPRYSLTTKEVKEPTLPHDVYGEQLDINDTKQTEVKEKLKKLYQDPNCPFIHPIYSKKEEEIEEQVDKEEWKKGNISTPPISPFESVNESIYDDIINDLEDEKEKINKIQDFIKQTTQKVEIDIDTPEEIEIRDEEPEILEPEPLDEPTVLEPEPMPADEELPMPMDLVVPTREIPEEDPFEPSADEKLVDETLKAEEKEPYEPDLMEKEDIEAEIELMNYEEEDEPQDEYVFHVKIDPGLEGEIIAKIFRDSEDDYWICRVVKGDEEPLQSMEFDPRLDKLEIIGYLADMYKEIEIIDKKEYEYLLDDKEEVDTEYYKDLVEKADFGKKAKKVLIRSNEKNNIK